MYRNNVRVVGILSVASRLWVSLGKLGKNACQDGKRGIDPRSTTSRPRLRIEARRERSRSDQRRVTISSSSHHVVSLPVPNPHLFRTHWRVLDPSSLKPQGSKPAALQVFCLPQELQVRPADQGIHQGLYSLCISRFTVPSSVGNSNYASSSNSAMTSLRPDFGLTEVQPEPQSANHVHSDRLLPRPYVFTAGPTHCATIAPCTHKDLNKCILPVLFLPDVALTRLMQYAVDGDDEHDESHSPQLGQAGRQGQRSLTHTSRTGGGLNAAAPVVSRLAQIAGKGAHVGDRLSARVCRAGARGRPPTRGVRGQ
ncbi:hypothetical protein B0H11DRAFT_1914883 [Mycena galericulata]|nr:hypothetical protein B0H11DRAFT_1914883 [Mycena galericulata]